MPPLPSQKHKACHHIVKNEESRSILSAASGLKICQSDHGKNFGVREVISRSPPGRTTWESHSTGIASSAFGVIAMTDGMLGSIFI
jgi:hypothetical protein